MTRFIMPVVLLATMIFAAGCGKKCPAGKACLYIQVLSGSIPPDHKKCETGLKIRGVTAVPAGQTTRPGARSISIGPPVVPIWTDGTMPPSCIYDFYKRGLAPGKWTVEFAFEGEKKMTCEIELVTGPKFNFLTHIKEHRFCGTDVGPARESGLD